MLEFRLQRDMKLKRQNLTKFVNNLENFPKWLKRIIIGELSKDLGNEKDLTSIFGTYNCILTYKGKCELETKSVGLDENIYNILDEIKNNHSIGEIVLNTYLSFEEIARYFLMILKSEYIEPPQNKKIIDIASFIAGKYRLGEYLLNDGRIQKTQLEDAVEEFQSANDTNNKFGQVLLNKGYITEPELEKIILAKVESQQRFILNYEIIPTCQSEYSNIDTKYIKKLSELESENYKLKLKLKQLSTMVKK